MRARPFPTAGGFADAAARPFPASQCRQGLPRRRLRHQPHLRARLTPRRIRAWPASGFARHATLPAFLRGDIGAAEASVDNPLAGGIDNALIFGSSQSGRWDPHLHPSRLHEAKTTDESSMAPSRTRLLTAAHSTCAGHSRTAYWNAAHRSAVSRPGIAAGLGREYRPDRGRHRRTIRALPQIANLPQDHGELY